MAGLFGFNDEPQVSNAGVEYATPAQLQSNPLAFNNPSSPNDYYKTQQNAVASADTGKTQGLTWKQIADIIAAMSGPAPLYNTPQGSVLQPTPNAAIPFYPLPVPPPQGMQKQGSSTASDMAVIETLGDAFGVPVGGKKT